jgi:hypothetical protein
MLTLRTRVIAMTAAAIVSSALLGVASASAAEPQAHVSSTYEADICNNSYYDSYTSDITGENQNGTWLTSPSYTLNIGQCIWLAGWWWAATPAITFYGNGAYAQANSCYFTEGYWLCSFPTPDYNPESY